MPVVHGYNIEATADAYWGERPPRNLSRSDIISINLFDAGHGDQKITKNPILYGLGATLRMALNFFVRTFTLTVQDISPGAPNPNPVDITAEFEKVFNRMYELRGRIGHGALNPGNRTSVDWGATVTLKFVLTTTAVTITTVSEMVMYILDGDDIRTCPDPCLDDLTMLQCLRENFLHFWRDKIDPTREPVGGPTPTNDLYFFFFQSDILMTVAPCICDCFNYYTLVMVGVHYFIVGDCEAAAEREYPNQAGCNPWQGEVPSAFGPCILPPGWPASTCAPPPPP